jgi:hypothetical protein
LTISNLFDYPTELGHGPVAQPPSRALSQNLFKKLIAEGFWLFFVLGRHPQFSVVILSSWSSSRVLGRHPESLDRHPERSEGSRYFVVVPAFACSYNPPHRCKSVSSLQFLNSFSEVIFILEFVILSGVWRGFLRQTQSKDPEEAHACPDSPALSHHLLQATSQNLFKN